MVTEIGDTIEEDDENGMSRSTELGGRERKKGGIRIKKQEKRNKGRETGEQESRMKRQRLEERGVESARTRRTVKNRSREEGGSKLEEWLRAYGITRETGEVKGVENHIRRFGNNERAEGYKFTFKLGTEKSTKHL